MVRNQNRGHLVGSYNEFDFYWARGEKPFGLV